SGHAPIEKYNYATGRLAEAGSRAGVDLSIPTQNWTPDMWEKVGAEFDKMGTSTTTRQTVTSDGESSRTISTRAQGDKPVPVPTPPMGTGGGGGSKEPGQIEYEILKNGRNISPKDIKKAQAYMDNHNLPMPKVLTA